MINKSTEMHLFSPNNATSLLVIALIWTENVIQGFCIENNYF